MFFATAMTVLYVMFSDDWGSSFLSINSSMETGSDKGASTIMVSVVTKQLLHNQIPLWVHADHVYYTLQILLHIYFFNCCTPSASSCKDNLFSAFLQISNPKNVFVGYFLLSRASGKRILPNMQTKVIAEIVQNCFT